MSKRFRYALEPLRLTRRWALDALLAELAEHNGRIAAQRSALRQLEAALAQAREDWLAGQASGANLALERLALLGRYLHDGAGRKREMEKQLAALEQARDDAAQRAAAAQRALDAVEEHRDDQRALFRRELASADLKTADDHWNVLQAKEREHELDG